MTIDQLDALRIQLDPLGQIGIAMALVLIMFGIALGLTTAHFRALLERPRVIIGGIVGQVVGLPALTIALVLLIEPAPSIALGMLVVACCPGGASSNLLTYLARGNVACSVSLTAASSLAAAMVTPVAILTSLNFYPPTATLLDSLGFDAGSFLIQTGLLLAVPLVAGMLVAAKFPTFAKRFRGGTVAAGGTILAVTIVYGLWYFGDILGPAVRLLAPLTVTHNALAFTFGALAGLLLGADRSARRALTFEIGIQNVGLALVILLGQLKGLGGATAVAAIWGTWHLLAGAMVVAVYRTVDRWRKDEL